MRMGIGLVPVVAVSVIGKPQLQNLIQLFEQGNCLGGNATRSLVSILSGIGPEVNQGFFREFSQKLKDCGYLIEAFNAPSDPEIIKSLSFDYVEKEGIELLLHTTVVDSSVPPISLS